MPYSSMKPTSASEVPSTEPAPTEMAEALESRNTIEPTSEPFVENDPELKL